MPSPVAPSPAVPSPIAPATPAARASNAGMRRDLVPLVLAGATAAVALALLVGLQQTLAYLVLVYALSVPGLALVRLLRLKDPLLEIVTGVMLSTSLAGLVALAQVYLGALSPPAVLWILIAVATVALAADPALVPDRARAAASRRGTAVRDRLARVGPEASAWVRARRAPAPPAVEQPVTGAVGPVEASVGSAIAPASAPDAPAPTGATAAPAPAPVAQASAWASRKPAPAEPPPSQPAEPSAAPPEPKPSRRRRRRQAGETAPDHLLDAPGSVHPAADDFFDGLVRRIEGDR